MKNKYTPKIDYPVIIYKNEKYICEPKLMQTMKNGNLYEYVGLGKNLKVPTKYINKKECWHWFYKFHIHNIPLKKFYIEVDYNDNPIDANYY